MTETITLFYPHIRIINKSYETGIDIDCEFFCGG